MPIYTVTLNTEPTERERRLLDRGIIQIAALVAAKISGKGLFINPGPSALSWDFGLNEEASAIEEEFVERLTPKVGGFIRAGFPEATMTVASGDPRLDVGAGLPSQPDLSTLSEQVSPHPGETPRVQGSAIQGSA